MDAEAKFIQTGEVLDYTPVAAKTAGQVVQVAGRAGICIDAIAAAAKGAIQIAGCVEVKKVQIAGSAGSPVGWDEDGNPYGGTAGAGALTTNLANADFIVGSLIENMATTDATAKVALNKFDPTKPIFEGFTFEEITVDKTLDAQDVGKAFIVTVDAKTITLPPTAAALGPIVIINGGADAAVAVNISPNASDKIMGPDIAGVDDKDQINTKATAEHWDYMIITADGSAGWYINVMKGTWAAEA